MINDWKNKKVAVLGLGVEGVSNVRFLVKRGADVTIIDKKTEKELEKEIKKLLRACHSETESRRVSEDEILRSAQDDTEKVTSDIKIITGENYLKNLSSFDVIVRSPGVKRGLPEIIEAEKNGVIITSQTKIFFDLCPCPRIGVTGTKGKSTTATLIYKMLKKQGFDVYLGGNIGKPPFDFLDKLNKHSWVVLELSSFQLQDLTKSPHIAVVLMMTQEHLDYHKDVEEYIDAKRNILRFQTKDDLAIINIDYPASHESDVYTKAKVFQISREREVEQGCFVNGRKIIVRRALKSPSEFDESSDASAPAVAFGDLGVRSPSATLMKTLSHRKAPRALFDQEIINSNDILLPGKHNLENVCAACMAASLSGVSKENVAEVLKTFKGLEHRLEFVVEKNGILFYNDSLSTVPEASIKAMETLPNTETLIAGGHDRGLDYSSLAEYLNKGQIKTLILFPPSGKRIWEEICKNTSEASRPKKFDVTTMDEAVRIAASKTTRGKICLLSPASASFGTFKDYKDRGDQFKEQVLKLKT